MFLDGKDSNGINYVTETLEKGEKNLGLKVNYEKTRMDSSRMFTTCCSGHLSCHAFPPAMHAPTTHAPCHACPLPHSPLPCNPLPHMPPAMYAPSLPCMLPAMHTPCHACPLPHMPSAIDVPCHTGPPAMQLPPPMDRQTPVKT